MHILVNQCINKYLADTLIDPKEIRIRTFYAFFVSWYQFSLMFFFLLKSRNWAFGWDLIQFRSKVNSQWIINKMSTATFQISIGSKYFDIYYLTIRFCNGICNRWRRWWSLLSKLVWSTSSLLLEGVEIYYFLKIS